MPILYVSCFNVDWWTEMFKSLLKIPWALDEMFIFFIKHLYTGPEYSAIGQSKTFLSVTRTDDQQIITKQIIYNTNGGQKILNKCNTNG